MYSTWKLNELKQELKRRGGSVGGRKVDLIERFECYDRNFNFGNQEFPVDDEPTMSLPPADLYKDVNSNTNLPPINKTQIRHYLSYTEKKMQKVIELYESRHLVAVRAQTLNNFTFIRAICRKTMKSMHYEMNVKLDNYGNIQMFCTGRKFCNFIVYTYKDMKVMNITRDEVFIQNMLTKLDIFYEDYFKKDILNKYLYNNYKILESKK